MRLFNAKGEKNKVNSKFEALNTKQYLNNNGPNFKHSKLCDRIQILIWNLTFYYLFETLNKCSPIAQQWGIGICLVPLKAE